MIPKYIYDISIPNSAENTLETGSNFSLEFPDATVFKKVELFLGFVTQANMVSHVLNYSGVRMNIKQLKGDAESVGMSLAEYLASDHVLDTCSISLKEFLRNNAKIMAEYIDKLESLTEAWVKYDLPSLAINY